MRASGNTFPDFYGYGPSDLQGAYDVTTASENDGSGSTVAIVDAYNDPTAEADLATYRSAAGLPPCTTQNGCFKQLNQNGQASPLPADAGAAGPDSDGWDVEESLDIDMVSAICPRCKIDLIEANSNSNADLYSAVDTGLKSADFESNSWGGSEYAGEAVDDKKYFDHPGKVITVSAGDSGYGVSFPAASQYVTSVGGTSLVQDDSARGWSESVWGPLDGGTGSGCSGFEAKPAWQTDTGCSHRTDNDIAADADPETGVAVYDTYSDDGWDEIGGTSASSPMIAAMYALAGKPASGSFPARYPYLHRTSLYDVTEGINSIDACDPDYLCTGEPGYDGPTGLGTPDGLGAFSSIVPPPPPQPPHATLTSPSSGQTYTVGQAVATKFSCGEGEGGPGLKSCDDSQGTDSQSGGQGKLGTASPGKFTYIVTALSADGKSATASIEYTVVAKAAPTADITVKLAGATRATPGSTFVERLTVSNRGPSTATNVISEIRVPRGLLVAHSNGGRKVGRFVRWGDPALAVGQRARYTLRLRAARRAVGRVVVAGGSVSTQVQDPNTNNNVAGHLVRLRPTKHHRRHGHH